MKIEWLIAYADNLALGFFKKQGFRHKKKN